MYRVAQQCCSGGNRPETSPETPVTILNVPRGVSGRKNTSRGLRGSPEDFRGDIIDGPHGMLCSSIYLRVWLQTCLEFFLHTDRKLVLNLRALSSMHCPVSQGRRKV